MRKRLRELATLFLKLGIISFGGPAAHIALLEEEVVPLWAFLDSSQFSKLPTGENRNLLLEGEFNLC